MKKVATVLGWTMIVLLLGAALSLVFAIPVYYLWNWLMPELFHLPTVTLWQALGLTLLCWLLFKSNTSGSSKK